MTTSPRHSPAPIQRLAPSRAARLGDWLMSAALVPERPGPRRAHKLSEAVVDTLAASRSAEPGLTSADLARIAQERFGLVVHRRSVERALARRKRGLRQQG